MRRYGTGSLERLPSGAWRARIRVGGSRLTFSSPSRVDARDWLDRKIGQRARGRGGSRANATLKDLRDEFLEDLKRAGRRASTLERLDSHVGVMLEHFGATRLQEIDGPFLERAVETMTGLGWSNATVRNRVGILTGMARYGQRRGYVAAVPLPVRRPKVVLESRPQPLTQEQEEALLEAAERAGTRYLAAIGLALWAGLRRGEIAGFEARDLDVKRRTVTVPVRDQEDQPKTGEARTVPVPDHLVAALRAVPAPTEGPLLGLPSGAALSHWVSRVWWGAGVDGTVRLHRLRHTWATRLGDRGATLNQLMAWGGWTTLVAVRRYLHGGDGLDRTIVDRATNVPRGTPKRATPSKKARRSG